MQRVVNPFTVIVQVEIERNVIERIRRDGGGVDTIPIDRRRVIGRHRNATEPDCDESPPAILAQSVERGPFVRSRRRTVVKSVFRFVQDRHRDSTNGVTLGKVHSRNGSMIARYGSVQSTQKQHGSSPNADLPARRHAPLSSPLLGVVLELLPIRPESPRRVSVLVPARNEERSIGPCVESLLRQGYSDDEFPVLDRYSTILSLR